MEFPSVEAVMNNEFPAVHKLRGWYAHAVVTGFGAGVVVGIPEALGVVVRRVVQGWASDH